MAAPPLLYQQVRMLAEAALGVPSGTTSTFYFQAGNTNGPVLLPPGTPPPADGVVMPAYNVNVVSPLSGVMLGAGTGGGGINAVDLPGGVQADAAFWTDAAVQKFVVPYYASCMGYEASRRLDRLQRVWNGTHPDGKQVYALLHVTGSPAPQPGGQPQSMEPIWVVFRDAQGTWGALPLADFVAPLPDLPEVQLPAEQAYAPPTPDVLKGRSPTYGALRSLAEWSASVHQTFMYFAYDSDTNTFSLTDGPGDGTVIVVPVQNPNVPSNRPTDIRVTLTLPDGASGSIFEWMSYQNAPGETFNRPDAFFWSTSAIEQFMVPYYASIDGFMGLPDLLSIQDALQQGLPAWGGNFTGGGTGAFLGPLAGEVLGLVHIPRSLWVTEEESAAIGESAFVHLSREGAPTVTRARQFIARTRADR